MNNQRELEHLLITELRKNDDLEDVISSYSIENVRVCMHCGKLMNEGWMYGGYETFCSERCLLAEHPDEDMKELRAHASDEDSETYWTAWGM